MRKRQVCNLVTVFTVLSCFSGCRDEGDRETQRKLETKSVPSIQQATFVGAAALNRGFINTLGMKFVPVEGTSVLFCEHETRVKDYAAYAAENPGVNMMWKDFKLMGHRQTGDHPVVNVNWEDANAFAEWLSKKEGKNYRLPTDDEWSVAVGIGEQEKRNLSPRVKGANRILREYPWGSTWPPPRGAGNLSGSESAIGFKFEGYTDPHAFTAPVKSYGGNSNGLFDLGGNVWEWCEDWYDSDRRVLRGGSWGVKFDLYFDLYLLSSYRHRAPSTFRFYDNGFRVVLVVGG